MKKSNIYTCTGDKGYTTLVGGKKISKTDPRLEAYGTVDELSAHIGVLSARLRNEDDDKQILFFIQNKLFVIGSYLATDTSFTELRDASKMTNEDVKKLENRIDEIDSQLPALNNFVLPGGGETAAIAHVCRTVCRRAERRICDVASEYETDENVLRFVNRLSDYLFVLARKKTLEENVIEIFWDKSCK